MNTKPTMDDLAPWLTGKRHSGQWCQEPKCRTWTTSHTGRCRDHRASSDKPPEEERST